MHMRVVESQPIWGCRTVNLVFAPPPSGASPKRFIAIRPARDDANNEVVKSAADRYIAATARRQHG